MATFSNASNQLYYESIGAGSTVLFIHGLGSSTQDWETQRASFSARHRMVCVDLCGHGRSSRIGQAISIPIFAQDTADLIRSQNLAPAHVVGISMGGMVAMQLALDAPHLLGRLVIVNSAPAIRPRMFPLRQNLHFIQRRLVLLFFGMQGMGYYISRMLFPEPHQADLRRICRERWTKNDRRAYEASMSAILHWDISHRLHEITRPVMVIAGRQDFIPLACKQAYSARMPDSRLVVIENSRHATPVDQADIFNRTVLDFLEA